MFGNFQGSWGTPIAKKNVSCCQLLAGLDEFEPPVQIKWYRADDEIIPETWKESNWTITLNKRSYCCHQIILGSGPRASNFFSSQFLFGETQTDLSQLLPEPCHGIWETVLDFFYLTNVTSVNFINVENIVPIYKTAQILRMKLLAQHCVHWLEEHLDHNTAFTILSAAIQLEPGLELVEKACTETIANQITICERDAFLGLDLTSLSQIFQQASKNVFGSRSDRKICNVVSNYMRHVSNDDEAVVFLKLSKSITTHVHLIYKSIQKKDPIIRIGFQIIDQNDALFLLPMCIKYNIKQLRAICLQFVAKNVDTVLPHEDWPLVFSILDDATLTAHDDATRYVYSLEHRSTRSTRNHKFF